MIVLRLLRAVGYGKGGQRGQEEESEGRQATPPTPSPPPKKQRDLHDRGALGRAKLSPKTPRLAQVDDLLIAALAVIGNATQMVDGSFRVRKSDFALLRSALAAVELEEDDE